MRSFNEMRESCKNRYFLGGRQTNFIAAKPLAQYKIVLSSCPWSMASPTNHALYMKIVLLSTSAMRLAGVWCEPVRLAGGPVEYNVRITAGRRHSFKRCVSNIHKIWI
jgi:hypothetical protein